MYIITHLNTLSILYMYINQTVINHFIVQIENNQ